MLGLTAFCTRLDQGVWLSHFRVPSCFLTNLSTLLQLPSEQLTFSSHRNYLRNHRLTTQVSMWISVLSHFLQLL